MKQFFLNKYPQSQNGRLSVLRKGYNFGLLTNIAETFVLMNSNTSTFIKVDLPPKLVGKFCIFKSNACLTFHILKELIEKFGFVCETLPNV